MPHIPILVRRGRFDRAEDAEHGVWICECCGEDCEEALCVYEVVRITRQFPYTRGVCLCSQCADRIPHGRVVSS